MMKTLSLLSAAFLLSATLASAGATTYVIDPVHSGVSFKVRHHFTKVPGSFAEFSGEIHFDAANPAASKVVASIDPKTVDTNNDKRDGHLQNEDFFDTAKYAAITFESTSWKPLSENTFEVVGDLTMIGVTKPVTLKAEFLGEGPGNRGSTISGWDVTGELDRDDWGLTYGPAVIGDTVSIEINIQARKQ